MGGGIYSLEWNAVEWAQLKTAVLLEMNCHEPLADFVVRQLVVGLT